MSMNKFSDKENDIDKLMQSISNHDSMFVQASLMQELCAKHSMTQNALAKRLRVSQSSIGNKIRLLQYSQRERRLIEEYGLTERHARTLLREKGFKREKLIETVGKMHLTVQETEEIVEKYRNTSAFETNETPLYSAAPIMTSEAFIKQLQQSGDQLRLAGHKVGIMIESKRESKHITIVIHEKNECFT